MYIILFIIMHIFDVINTKAKASKNQTLDLNQLPCPTFWGIKMETPHVNTDVSIPRVRLRNRPSGRVGSGQSYAL